MVTGSPGDARRQRLSAIAGLRRTGAAHRRRGVRRGPVRRATNTGKSLADALLKDRNHAPCQGRQIGLGSADEADLPPQVEFIGAQGQGTKSFYAMLCSGNTERASAPHEVKQRPIAEVCLDTEMQRQAAAALDSGARQQPLLAYQVSQPQFASLV